MAALVFVMGFLFAAFACLVSGSTVGTAVQGGILSFVLSAWLLYLQTEGPCLNSDENGVGQKSECAK